MPHCSRPSRAGACRRRVRTAPALKRPQRWKSCCSRQRDRNNSRGSFTAGSMAGSTLPDLAIVTVAPRRVERSAPVNYLPQARQPVGGPIGAEPVPQADDRRAGQQATASSSGGGAPAPGSWLVAVEVQNNGGTGCRGARHRSQRRADQHAAAARRRGQPRDHIRVPFEAEPGRGPGERRQCARRTQHAASPAPFATCLRHGRRLFPLYNRFRAQAFRRSRSVRALPARSMSLSFRSEAEGSAVPQATNQSRFLRFATE